ncbi:CotY/CotZ family spore coat protein [Metabacillus halosaccharovorans]|uniref:CotY/CotZ family spore coat protein n=1 Tax=Metabacillus halosaccharovorans TaxID=930124 RepID=A0ABT3DP41_9BACI|nr:CotY/CotZ family spore coat protein [Metabacillus halosaccharovorans]MCV9888797.1 CotY/CotZ family spore coat protein [Metabacillus halosaccharovorans]
MGCKDKKDRDNNCVCEAVEQILAEQEAVEEISCPTSCYSNLLGPVSGPQRDTIPFILYGKKGELFKAFGNVGGFNGDMTCFQTIFFRVEAVEDCCATLSLLRPVDVDGNTLSVCNPCDEDFFGLEKTDFCIEVDLDCFCAIQCLSPELVDRVADERKKCHK